VPCEISQRLSLSKVPVTTSVLNSITPQNVIQSTFHTPVRRAVQVGEDALFERHLPDPESEHQRDQGADQGRHPRRPAQSGQHEQQRRDRDQRDSQVTNRFPVGSRT